MVSSITNNLGFGISKYYEDNRNLIVGVSNYFGSSSISSFIYENDALGRRSQRVDDNIDYSVAMTNSFAYNNYSEVTNAIMNTNDYNFTFDDIGNMLLLENNDGSNWENYINKLNQLEDSDDNEDIGYVYSYDLDGNMTNETTWIYTNNTWDIEANKV
jgi:hypothetical protein